MSARRVGDLLAAGAGVCPDFAHLALLLRRHGLGARYVCGYLWAPSNGDEASAEVETHVKIGYGRHSADVPPIKGVYRGMAGSERSASVRMTRSDVSPSRA